MNNGLYINLLDAYHSPLPEFIKEFASTSLLQRIKNIGMNCGMEYTSFPLFKNLQPYSRYEHSLGVGLIAYHFSKDIKVTLAALFHDVATPAFAHVVDFLKGDYLTQEATESQTFSVLDSSSEVKSLLRKYGLSVDDIADYHLYPIADNDSPRLSSDRLEYTLGNFVNFHLASKEEVISLYDDLRVAINSEGQEEIAFISKDKVLRFASLALKNSQIYVSDEDRYGMEYLSQILKKAISEKVITEEDLYKTEDEVIRKLSLDEECQMLFDSFRRLSKVYKKEGNPKTTFIVNAKKRYIDPYIISEKKRASKADEGFNKALKDFLTQSFSYPLTADC